jgi:beta-galactosidase
VKSHFKRLVSFVILTTAVGLLLGPATAQSNPGPSLPPMPSQSAPGSTLAAKAATTFEIGPDAFLLNGQPFVLRIGEIHSARVPREYWRHRLQMAKAMGLNAVCAYLFWNQVEPREGEFDWSGMADTAEFCRLAQAEGLWVVLRPGPYACAEWEMGGLPWWLLKHEDIQLRTRDPRFIAAARRYLREVGRQLAPLQVTRGGPILMVQAENEYGFFGKDAAYMGEIRQALLDAGFEVPLFACNPIWNLPNGYRSDLFPVVNFGSDPEGAFKALRQILPTGPLMCGEFYPGWFDTWGQPHHRGNVGKYLRDLETMLQMNASFSIYMAHGGTSFGFTTGADRPFKPDTSSYDYDAPISEAGWVTDKFFKTRDLFARFLQPGESIPPPPAAHPVIAFPPARSIGFAPLLAALPTARRAERPLNLETLDQPHGAVLYRTTLPAGPEAVFKAEAVHDIGHLFLDGVRVSTFDRRSRVFLTKLPAREKPAVLELLVEAMGRVNFGVEIHDRKGLHGPVRLGDEELLDWEIVSLPLDAAHLSRLDYQPPSPAPAAGLPFERSRPGFHRFEVDLQAVGDTFLDLRPWGKGMVWVNGRNLGYFWNIGPQQTMFVPGPWLKPGRNEFVVLDYFGDVDAELSSFEKPVLDVLRPELDILRPQSNLKPLRVDGEAAHRGSFAPGGESQPITFTTPRKGRYFALEALDAHDGGRFASIGDLSLVKPDGTPLSSQLWSIVGVSSQETVADAAGAGNAIDGQISNHWLSAASSSYPHWIVIDLGREETLGGFVYVPRQGTAADAIGRIKTFQAYVGLGLKL